MKISYGEKIKRYSTKGTVYNQRVLLTGKELKSINLGIVSEIEMGYPQYREYAGDINTAKMFLKPISINSEGTANLKNTQVKYISRYVETKGRLKLDRNTYIKLKEENNKGKKEKIRDWYIKTYPKDKLGFNINNNITFHSAFKCLEKGKDFSNFLGVGDSVVRERVFKKLAIVMNCTYDYIYNQWIRL